MTVIEADFHLNVQDEKHLAHITPRLKARYHLHPAGSPESTAAGVNMSLLAYAGPYKAIGQSIRSESLDSFYPACLNLCTVGNTMGSDFC